MYPADKSLLAVEREDAAVVPLARHVAEVRLALTTVVPPRARDARLTAEFALRGGDDSHGRVWIPQVLELPNDPGDSADHCRRYATVGSGEVVLGSPRVGLLDRTVDVLAEPQEDDLLDLGITLRGFELVSHVEDVPIRAGLRAGSEDVLLPLLGPVDRDQDSEHLAACGRGDVRDLFDDTELLCELDGTGREVVLDPTDRIADELRDLRPLLGTCVARERADLLDRHFQQHHHLEDGDEHGCHLVAGRLDGGADERGN